MENNTKRYWKGLEELRNDASFIKGSEKEFNAPTEGDASYEHLTDGSDSNRRDFLKVLGFGMAAVSLASCEAPVRKAVSYVNKPVDEYPTIANWYASTFAEGGDYASILVKTREGRPIKIESNKLSGASRGASSRAHASLLNLYDIEKLKGPSKGGEAASWEVIDKEIETKLASIAAEGGEIRIVSSTVLSPSTKAVLSTTPIQLLHWLKPTGFLSERPFCLLTILVKLKWWSVSMRIFSEHGLHQIPTRVSLHKLGS
jgi:MoCo/4Fe-4S cofactor protein with predicted Tat translocation signal